MVPNWKFSPAYYDKSLDTLKTAFDKCSGYKTWREFDPGSGFPVDARYAAMPWLTKKAIREHFPDGFVPAGQDLKQAMENDRSMVRDNQRNDGPCRDKHLEPRVVVRFRESILEVEFPFE